MKQKPFMPFSYKLNVIETLLGAFYDENQSKINQQKILDKDEVEHSCICGMSPKRRRVPRIYHGNLHTQPSNNPFQLCEIFIQYLTILILILRFFYHLNFEIL
jgi:hypothetical protein